ncbi:MAG TPA: cupredoxin domain-containing protein [Mycobacterium sp.]|nr:cupredoxin domain-containing protein [Mycobacterium sp.]
MAVKRTLVRAAVLALALSLVLAGCAKGRSKNGNSASAGAKKATKYTPQTRNISMFAVPAWIGEMAEIPQYKEFAPKDFAKGGINDGNEVFSWQPQMIAACAGDTIKLAIGNPGPDDHTFTLPDLSVNTPVASQKITNVTINATKVGIYDYYCTVAEHTKYMHGTLLVFADDDAMCGGS